MKVCDAIPAGDAMKKMLQSMRIIGLLKDLVFNHWKVAIFRKIRVELELLRATYNRLPRDLFRFSDRF